MTTSFPLSATHPVAALDKAESIMKRNTSTVDPPFGLNYLDSCKKALGRAHPVRPGMIHPQLNSADPRHVAFLKELERQATRQFPAEPLATGFSLNGAPSDFSGLLSLPDVAEYPTSLAPIDNRKLRADKGLVNEISPGRDMAITEAVLQLYYEKLTWTDYRFVLDSSLSLPTCSRERKVKTESFFRLLNNLGEVVKLLKTKDYGTLYRRYGAARAHILYRRLQSDKWERDSSGQRVPKVRESFAYDAKRGFYVVNASKFAPIDLIGLGTHDVCAKRDRVVYGAPGALAMLGSCLIQLVRDHRYRAFPFALHHTTAVEMTAKLRAIEPEWVVGCDVTKHDWYQSDLFFKVRSRFLHEQVFGDLTYVLDSLLYAPYFAPQREPGGKAFFSGNPLDPKCHQVLGLPSGLPDNPELGTDWMTIVYLTLLADLDPTILTFRGGIRDSLAAFLRGEHPNLALMLKSDDAMFIGPKGTTITRERMIKHLEKGSKYMLLGPELILAFLGNIGYATADAAFSRFAPSVVSGLVNGYSPETGLRLPYDTNARKLALGRWSRGVLARFTHYSTSETAGDALRLAEDIWRTMMPDISTPRAVAAKIDPTFRPEELTEIERRLIIDPERARWSLQPGDVPDEVLNSYTGVIGLKHFKAAFSPYLIAQPEG